jgi:hypothetical protein
MAPPSRRALESTRNNFHIRSRADTRARALAHARDDPSCDAARVDRLSTRALALARVSSTHLGDRGAEEGVRRSLGDHTERIVVVRALCDSRSIVRRQSRALRVVVVIVAAIATSSRVASSSSSSSTHRAFFATLGVTANDGVTALGDGVLGRGDGLGGDGELLGEHGDRVRARVRPRRARAARMDDDDERFGASAAVF